MFQLLNGLLFLLLQDPAATVDAVKSSETPVVTPAAAETASVVDESAAAASTDSKTNATDAEKTAAPVTEAKADDGKTKSDGVPAGESKDGADGGTAKPSSTVGENTAKELPVAGSGAWVAWLILLLVIAVPSCFRSRCTGLGSPLSL